MSKPTRASLGEFIVDTPGDCATIRITEELVITITEFEIDDEEEVDRSVVLRKATFALGGDENARALFNWLGKYLHGVR